MGFRVFQLNLVRSSGLPRVPVGSDEVRWVFLLCGVEYDGSL